MLPFRKMVTALMLLEAWTPTLWGAGIIVFAILSRYELGYWPAPSRPDPKLLPFEGVHTALFFLTYPAFLSFPVLGFTRKFAPALWMRSKRPALLGWGLLGILTFIPGIQFVPWFLD